MLNPIRVCIAALVVFVVSCVASASGADGSSGAVGGATNNWAVLVSTVSLAQFAQKLIIHRRSSSPLPL